MDDVKVSASLADNWETASSVCAKTDLTIDLPEIAELATNTLVADANRVIALNAGLLFVWSGCYSIRRWRPLILARLDA